MDADSSKMDAVKIYFPETYIRSNTFSRKKLYIAFGNYCFAQVSGLTCAVSSLVEVPEEVHTSKDSTIFDNFWSFLSFSLKCLKDDQQFEFSISQKNSSAKCSHSHKPSLPQATKILGLVSFLEDNKSGGKSDSQADHSFPTAFRKFCFKKLQRSFWVDLAFRKGTHQSSSLLSWFSKNNSPPTVHKRDIFLKNDKKLSVDGHSLQIIFYNQNHNYFAQKNVPCKEEIPATQPNDSEQQQQQLPTCCDLSVITNWINNSSLVTYRLLQCQRFVKMHSGNLYSLAEDFYSGESEKYVPNYLSRFYQLIFYFEVFKHNLLCYLIVTIFSIFFFNNNKNEDNSKEAQKKARKDSINSTEGSGWFSWPTVKYYLSLMSSARQFLFKIKLIFRDIPEKTIQLLKFKLRNHYSVVFAIDTTKIFKKTSSIPVISNPDEYYSAKQHLTAVASQLFLDILFSNLFYWFIIRKNLIFSYFYPAKDFTSSFSMMIWKTYIHLCQQIINHLDWLMGWPAGLKLNRHLSMKMGTYSIQGVAWWVELLSLLVFGERKYLLKQKNFIFVTNTMDMIQMDGKCVCLLLPVWWQIFGNIWKILGCCLGMTFYFSIFLDLAHIFFAQIYFMFFLHSKIFNFFCSNIAAFWRLFCGRRNNILKKRIDHFQFSTEQLFIGTLFFTVLVFLFPTVCVYFLSMCAFIVIALFFYSVSRIIVVSISLPWVPLLFMAINKVWWFHAEEKQKTEIYLEILENQKTNGIDFLRLNGKGGRSFTEILKMNYDEIVSLVLNPV